MNPEREVLNFWFNRNGYLTLHNIKVGHNKEIYMLALKIENGHPAECIHVETHISVSLSLSMVREQRSLEKETHLFIRKKFEDPGIKKKIGELLSSYNLESRRKLVILGKVPNVRKKSIVAHFRDEGVETAWFSKILFDAIASLDGQAYQNNTVRTLQLVKFLLLGEPEQMAEAFKNFLTWRSKRSFLSSALEGNEKLLASPDMRDTLAEAFFTSDLSRPEILSELLANKMGRKSYSALLRRMLKRTPSAKTRKRTEKTLTNFIEQS